MRNPNKRGTKLNFTALIFPSAVIAGLWIISGCQSNTIYFGTNTQFGIRAGVDTKQIPEVEIGYNRQEGVMLPLTVKSTNSPCAGTGTNPPFDSNQKFLSHYQEGNTDIQDAYSVLATFSGQAGGSAGSSNTAGANLGVAQYFATGDAAVMLARQGGAAAVGGAQSAVSPIDTSVAGIVNTQNKERSALIAYFTSPDGSLDKARLKAIATTNIPPDPPNDMSTFLNSTNGTAVSAVQSNMTPPGPWAGQVDYWYRRYTNIINNTQP